MSKGTLRLALVGGDRYTPLYDRLLEFTERTGYSTRIAKQVDLPELIPHLRDSLHSGEEYHLVSAHSQYMPALAPLLRPLDDLLSPEEIREYAAPALEMCRWEGALYGAPRSVETRLLYYRSDIFEDRRERQWFTEASDGRELRVPRTWDELAAVAQYFTRSGKMHGFAFPGRGAGLVATFAEVLTTVGGTFFDEAAQPQFTGALGEWSLALLRDLYTRWGAVPPETPDLGYEEVSEMFRMGRCAMACDFSNTARLLTDPTFSAVAGWHSAALYPAGTGGRRAVWTGCPTFAIPANCPDPEAALELLRFLAGHESQVREARHGAIPSRIGAFQEAKENLRDGTLAHLRFTLVEQTLRLGLLTAPKLRQYPEIEERLWPLFQEAITGARDVSEALELARYAVEETMAVG